MSTAAHQCRELPSKRRPLARGSSDTRSFHESARWRRISPRLASSETRPIPPSDLRGHHFRGRTQRKHRSSSRAWRVLRLPYLRHDRIASILSSRATASEAACWCARSSNDAESAFMQANRGIDVVDEFCRGLEGSVVRSVASTSALTTSRSSAARGSRPVSGAGCAPQVASERRGGSA